MFAFEDFSKHYPITNKTIKGKIKCCWFIFLYKKMTKPSTPIAREKSIGKILNFCSKNKINKKNKEERCAYKMQ